MSQEYRIPDGIHNPAMQVGPVRDEIDHIFVSQTVECEPSQITQEVHPIIGRLMEIGYNIADLRSYRLDTQFFHKDHGNGFVKSVSKFLFGREASTIKLQPLTEDHLRIKESEVTSSIFSTRQLPEGQVETFSLFNHGPKDWYLHQLVSDPNTKSSAEVTLHYQIHPHGVLLSDSRPEKDNRFIVGNELTDFVHVTEVYHEVIQRDIYETSVNLKTISPPPIIGPDDGQLAA